MLIRPMSASSFFGDSLTAPQRPAGPAQTRPAVIRWTMRRAAMWTFWSNEAAHSFSAAAALPSATAGWGGDTVDRLLARYEQDVLPLSPTMMVLWVGQNDAKALCEERFAQQLHLFAKLPSGPHPNGRPFYLCPPQPPKDARARAHRLHPPAAKRRVWLPLHRCKSADGPPHAAKPAAGMADSAVHHRLPPVGAGESAGGGHGI